MRHLEPGCDAAVSDRIAVVVSQQEAPGYGGISIRVGSHVGLFDTGSGYVLLAFRSPEERTMMIVEHMESTDQPGLDPEFAARLDQIRDRGYEMMPSVQRAGVVNLSAPVLGPDGCAIASLTIFFVTLVNVPAAPDISGTIQLRSKPPAGSRNWQVPISDRQTELLI
jgi:DNA-binding IclR family transcriptional regulator